MEQYKYKQLALELISKDIWERREFQKNFAYHTIKEDVPGIKFNITYSYKNIRDDRFCIPVVKVSDVIVKCEKDCMIFKLDIQKEEIEKDYVAFAADYSDKETEDAKDDNENEETEEYGCTEFDN